MARDRMVPNALTASMVEFERVSDDDDHGHEREIRQAFDVLDVRGDKSISVQDLQTIYLGLGYVPPVSVEELQRRTLQYDDSDERDHSARVTLDTTLKILLQCRKRDLCQVIEAGFRSIDHGNKGYLDARDVQRLAKEASGREISSLKAEHMISYFKDSCDDTGADQAKSSVRLGLNEFRKLLKS